jgi:hypothetical protein
LGRVDKRVGGATPARTTYCGKNHYLSRSCGFSPAAERGAA